MEGSRIGRGRGIDRPERGPRELGVCLDSTATRAVFMVLECAVMAVMSMLDSLFVEGGLLDGSMRSPQPGQGRDWLGEDHDQDQHIRRHNPQKSAIEALTLMRRPSHQPRTILSYSPNFREHPLPLGTSVNTGKRKGRGFHTPALLVLFPMDL